MYSRSTTADREDQQFNGVARELMPFESNEAAVRALQNACRGVAEPVHDRSFLDIGHGDSTQLFREHTAVYVRQIIGVILTCPMTKSFA